jgi:hypothetical protein
MEAELGERELDETGARIGRRLLQTALDAAGRFFVLGKHEHVPTSPGSKELGGGEQILHRFQDGLDRGRAGA